MPAVTDYERRDLQKNCNLLIGKKQRAFVHSYDVTEFLTADNVLRVLVGNGYYHNIDRPEEPYVSYGDKKLIFALYLRYEDGEEAIFSDGSLSVKYLNELSGLYTGDFVDFSAEEEDFVSAVEARPVDGELQIIDAKEGLADVVGEVLTPISVKRIGDGLIYDFGVNHSGGAVFTVKGPRGRRIKIRFAEVLHENGEPNYETARWECYDTKGVLQRLIDQVGEYVLSGDEDRIEPKFSWHCYRYVIVEEARDLEITDMRSYFLYMDMEKSGAFACSEPLLNEIYEKTRRTLLCNLHSGLLTDCPHREKRPYTGDGGVIAETLLYDLNSLPFFDKWLDDIIYSQTEDGFIPYTVPYLGGGGGYAWSNVIATLPVLLYRFTGKIAYIEKSYPALVKWLGYYKAHSVHGVVVSTTGQAWCLGDWLAPEITEFHIPFMSTLCYHQAAEAAAFCAKVLQNGDEGKWTALKAEIAAAINENFFNKGKITYCKGIQGENVLPLAYGIVPKEYEERLKEKVRYKYAVENEFHLDTGIIATPIVLEYLTMNGMEEIAYRLMTAIDYPSFAYMLEGETTLSEHWSKKWPDYHIGNSDVIVKGGGQLSHCHPMFGSVVAWLYKRVAGIDLTELAQKHINFRPCFTQYLTSASARVKTYLGEASIEWNTERGFEAKIVLPEGAHGTFEISTNASVCIETEKGAKREYASENGKISFPVSNGTSIVRICKN